MFVIFLKSLIIGYSGAMMPGSLFTFAVEKSMRFDVKARILVSFGHVILEFFLVVLIFLGAGQYLDTGLKNYNRDYWRNWFWFI